MDDNSGNNGAQLTIIVYRLLRNQLDNSTGIKLLSH